jgi:hypothetical protein
LFGGEVIDRLAGRATPPSAKPVKNEKSKAKLRDLHLKNEEQIAASAKR